MALTHSWDDKPHIVHGLRTKGTYAERILSFSDIRGSQKGRCTCDSTCGEYSRHFLGSPLSNSDFAGVTNATHTGNRNSSNDPHNRNHHKHFNKGKAGS